jgi:hypothetical protein
MDAATGAISPCKAAWFLGPQPDAWAIHPHAGLREHDPESFSRAHSAAAMTIEHVSRRYTIQRNNAGHPIHMHQYGRHWHTTPKVLRPTPRDVYMPCRRSLHGQPYPHASTETTYRAAKLSDTSPAQQERHETTGLLSSEIAHLAPLAELSLLGEQRGHLLFHLQEGWVG